ncbi:hypothetical protein IWZ03DRAFT_358847 [Phyllosticta citriasiana]|uniref:Uncharacterized protein n=1 Tax=Phyllosticta citriasiana TaxID=595635 RepID=A0ABR1KNP2_9PEZI
MVVLPVKMSWGNVEEPNLTVVSSGRGEEEEERDVRRARSLCAIRVQTCTWLAGWLADDDFTIASQPFVVHHLSRTMPSPTPSSNTANSSSGTGTSLRHRTRSWLRSVFHLSPSHGTSTTVPSGGSGGGGATSSTFTPSSFFSFPSSGNHHSTDKGKAKRVHKEMGDGYWGLDSGASEESLEWGGSGLVRGGEGVEGRDWVPGTAL